MKILKAKNKLKKSKIFKISELTSVDHNLFLDDLYETGILNDPIEIKIDNHSSVMGAQGIFYKRKKYVVFRGSRRINTAKKMGYTHIEGVIIE
jgi:hypothetical protein